MTDLQILFLVLVALYGWECACWLKRGSIAYRTWFGRLFRAAHPVGLFGNQKGGFVFAAPLPPLGTIFVACQSPVSYSPDAVLAFIAASVNPGSRPPQSGKLFAFDEIRSVSAVARKVFINGEPFLRAASPGLAVRIVNELQELKSLPATKRPKSIQNIVRDSLDTKAIEQRCREFKDQTQSLLLLTNVLFVYLFILAPLVISRFGLAVSWAGLAVGLLACTTAIAVLFRRTHKQFFPLLEEDRFTHFLIILLSPATAVRALDLLSRPLLELYHPLAVAKVLSSQAEFSVLASNYLRELTYPALPVCPTREPSAVQAEKENRLLLKLELEKLLKRSGLDPSDLLRPPPRSDTTCLSYCPRCLAQFTTVSGICEDCGGIPLLALALPN